MRASTVALGVTKAAALVAIWFLLRRLAVGGVPDTVRWTLVVVPLLLVGPVSWAGRRALDARPERVVVVTAAVDLVLIVLFGTALVAGIRSGAARPGWRLPIPEEIGLALMWVTGPVVALTVVNLAVRGLGAPFAAPISRRLATDWLYRYTRNPMVLALLLFLLALGLRLRSAWFVAWVAALVAPAWLVYLALYEERELELRFGSPYLAYRGRTPMLWPRLPGRAGTGA